MSASDFSPVAPRNSPSHIRLIEFADAAGINTELLRDLLWLITAHDYLIALPMAAATLLKILDLAPPSWDEPLAESGLPSFRVILEWIIKNDEVLARDIGDHFNRVSNSTGKNPISGSGRGYLYPLYAPLCEIRTQVLDENSYVLLIGQFLLANMIAIREFSTREEYESSENKPWNPLPNGIEAVALAVRRLAKGKYRKFLLDFEVELSPEDFTESLETIDFSWDTQGSTSVKHVSFN